jgi:hypothetical protein
MTIDLKTETPLSLTAAARLLPPGRRGRPTTLSCILRWVLTGVKTPAGVVRLEAVRMGGRWITTHEALARFANRQTPKLEDPPIGLRTRGVRERACARAAKELERAGIT